MQANSRQIMASVAVRPLPHRRQRSRDRDRRARSAADACGKEWPGGRSFHLKKHSGGDPMQSKAQIDQVLRQKSDAREIPGVVVIAANSKETIYQGAFGKRDLSKDDAMTLDSV